MALAVVVAVAAAAQVVSGLIANGQQKEAQEKAMQMSQRKQRPSSIPS